MSSKSRGKRGAILMAVVIVAVTVAGVWLVRNRSAPDGTPSAGTSSTAAVTAEQVATIAGRWRRTDGGYIVEIRGLGADGHLEALYFNPSPINVSQAEVVQGARGLHVFIELRDTGYPGATYRLDYDATGDTMTGFYYQPTAGQTFDVVFVRAQ